MAVELLRVVLDTNVVVSAAIKSQSIAAYVVSAGLDRRFQVCYSNEVIDEYREVLARGKFRLLKSAVDELIAGIQQAGEAYTPTKRSSRCLDPADNKFLDCAELSRAHYLVTGNKRHFPPRHKVTRVISPRELATIMIAAGIL